MTQADRVYSTPPTNAPVAPTRRCFISQAAGVAAGGAALALATTPPASAAAALALLWHFRLGDICKEHVTVRTLSGWRSCEEVEDRLPDGRHAWLWWRS
jgi:hypothetical protein